MSASRARFLHHPHVRCLTKHGPALSACRPFHIGVGGCFGGANSSHPRRLFILSLREARTARSSVFLILSYLILSQNGAMCTIRGHVRNRESPATKGARTVVRTLGTLGAFYEDYPLIATFPQQTGQSLAHRPDKVLGGLWESSVPVAVGGSPGASVTGICSGLPFCTLRKPAARHD